VSRIGAKKHMNIEDYYKIISDASFMDFMESKNGVPYFNYGARTKSKNAKTPIKPGLSKKDQELLDKYGEI
jgi:hypothetical protein